MRSRGPARGSSCDWRKVILVGLFLLSSSAIRTRGQDAAEAARQEKARKAEEHKVPGHVYTEEDLRRRAILTSDDQARVEVRKRQQSDTSAEQNAKQAPDDASPQNESLGEIARRYRQEKSAREAELAAEKKFTPFPYAIPSDSLADPHPGVAPVAGNVAGAEIIGQPVDPVRRHSPFAGGVVTHGRVSPFQPRPLSGASPAPPPGLAVLPVVLDRSTVRSVAPAPLSEKSVPSTPSIQGMKRVKVQKGQSWWKLAELYLYNGARWQELRTLNADASGRKELLMLGSTVLVPEVIRANLHPSVVKVQKGDSLWSLAHEHLGRGSAWNCLAIANPKIFDYTRLAIGTVLDLPEGSALQSCRRGNLDQVKK
jgi:nucleoid-associated protein YgaU